MPTRGRSARRDIVSLTSVRGIAAIWVVVFHFVNLLAVRGWPPSARPNGLKFGPRRIQIAVDVFFILVGLILAKTYENELHIPKFFLNRFARIYPLHIVILSAMALGVLHANNGN